MVEQIDPFSKGPRAITLMGLALMNRANTSPRTIASLPHPVSSLGKCWALGLTATGEPRTLTTTLPASLTDANWGLKAEMCEAGGYDLSVAAGGTVCLVIQGISQKCDGYAASAAVVMKDDAVVCVYKALFGGGIVPGVYSATNSASCQ